MMSRPRSNDRGLQFTPLTILLRKHSVSILAEAINRYGIYTWDEHQRFIKAENDIQGWVCRIDDKTMQYRIMHVHDRNTASRSTQSRALALLAICIIEEDSVYQESIAMGRMHLLHFFELGSFGWRVDTLPDLDTIQQEKMVTGIVTPAISLKQQQFNAITGTIESLGYDPLCIPYGGKAKIMQECLASYNLFTTHSFEHIWKAGKNLVPQHWEVENINKYKNN